MDVMLLRTFQRQVVLQCEFMLLAAAELNEALKDGTSAVQQTTTRVFFSIQNLLNAAANISKAFWGQRGRFAAERQALRDSVGIPDTSPLRDVNMRNNFEHLDERLDKWWAESARHNHADLNIGPIGAIAGLDDIDMFRLFDPHSTEIVFWSQRFNLQSLIDEVQRVLPTLRAEAAKPHWEP